MVNDYFKEIEFWRKKFQETDQKLNESNSKI